MRSVLMVSNFFPFFMRYWLEVFNIWKDEVDKVYIGMEKPVIPGTEDYLRKLFKHPKIELMDGYTEQFKGLTNLYKQGNEEKVLIVHDDTFILKKGYLDSMFDQTKEGKVITPCYRHYSPGEYVEELMHKRFGGRVPFVTRGSGDKEYSFLLYLFFATRKDLDKTSLIFSGSHYLKGEHCEPLGEVLKQNIGGDTGFQLGLELLSNNVVIDAIPHRDNTTNYLPDLDDPLKKLEEMRLNRSGVFSIDWIHIMSMANMFKIWFDPNRKGERESEYEKVKDNPMTKRGHEIKLAWLQEFMSVDNFSEIAKQRDFIKEEVKYMVEAFKLDQENIDKYQNYFHEIVWQNA